MPLKFFLYEAVEVCRDVAIYILVKPSPGTVSTVYTPWWEAVPAGYTPWWEAVPGDGFTSIYIGTLTINLDLICVW